MTNRYAEPMAGTAGALLERWRNTIGGDTTVGADLLGRYAEPHRHYHDVRHLAEVLVAIDDLASLTDYVRVVRLAAWFHDAVYDPRASDNEVRSAALAQAALPPPVGDRVAALVRLTADHAPPRGDADAAVLCDADLAILAAPQERYIEYAGGVRREYAHVHDDVFSTARAAILTGLLARERLYATDAAYALWERKARRNVRGEISALGGDASPRH